jgi:hypothetical protein
MIVASKQNTAQNCNCAKNSDFEDIKFWPIYSTEELLRKHHHWNANPRLSSTCTALFWMRVSALLSSSANLDRAAMKNKNQGI